MALLPPFLDTRHWIALDCLLLPACSCTAWLALRKNPLTMQRILRPRRLIPGLLGLISVSFYRAPSRHDLDSLPCRPAAAATAPASARLAACRLSSLRTHACPLIAQLICSLPALLHLALLINSWLRFVQVPKHCYSTLRV